MAPAERWGSTRPGVTCWGLLAAGAPARAVPAQESPADGLVPEPERFSEAGWVKSEEKQLFGARMPFSQLGQTWRLVSKRERSRLWMPLSQALGLVWCSSGLPLGALAAAGMASGTPHQEAGSVPAVWSNSLGAAEVHAASLVPLFFQSMLHSHWKLARYV